MLDYEVLILDERANPRAFVEMQDCNDDGAIRFATCIANGRPFEVWRDIVCIHRSSGTSHPLEQPIARWRGLKSVGADLPHHH